MVTISSYPRLTRAIKDRLRGNARAKRTAKKYGISYRNGRLIGSKESRLNYAKDMGWIYNPPVKFGTNTPTTIYESSGVQQVRENGKIVGTLSTPSLLYEQRVEKARFKRGVVEVSPKFETLDKQTQKNIRLEQERLKRDIELKTGVKYTEFPQQLRYRTTKPKEDLGQVTPWKTQDPLSKVLVPTIAYTTTKKETLKPTKKEFITESTKKLDLAEKRFLSGTTTKADDRLIEKLDPILFLSRVMGKPKKITGSLALGAADAGLMVVQFGAVGVNLFKEAFSLGKIIGKPKSEEAINLKNKIKTTDYKKLIIKGIPKGAANIIKSEGALYIKNPIRYISSWVALAGIFKALSGTLKLTNKAITTTATTGAKTIKATGKYLNKLGENIKFESKFKISSKGKVTLEYKLKPKGKPIKIITKQIVLKSSVVKAISKATPSFLKTASKTTQKYIKTITSKLTDLKIYKTISKTNTNIRIKTIPRKIYIKNIKRLDSIKRAIINNRITQKTLDRLQFLKDDLRRFNIKLSYNLNKLKIKGGKLIKSLIPKKKLKLESNLFKGLKLSTQRYIKKVERKLSDLKLYKSISKYNTNIRIKNITLSTQKRINKYLKSIEKSIKTNKITKKTLDRIQFIKDDLRRFNINLKLTLSNLKKKGLKLKGKIKEPIRKIKQEIKFIGKEKLTRINENYINKIKTALEKINLYKSLAKYRTNLRIKNITTSRFNKIKQKINKIKLDIKNNKITRKTLDRLQFIKDSLKKFNIKLSYDLTRFKKLIKTKAIRTLKKISPFEIITTKRSNKLINDSIKKLKTPIQKQILKNLYKFGKPKYMKNNKYGFKNKLTGDITYYPNFLDWYNVTTQHGRFLLTNVGKKTLRKVKRLKTRTARIKAYKTERLWQKEDLLKKIGKQPKAIKELSRREIRKIKRTERVKELKQKKLLIKQNKKGKQPRSIKNLTRKQIKEIKRKLTEVKKTQKATRTLTKNQRNLIKKYKDVKFDSSGRALFKNKLTGDIKPYNNLKLWEKEYLRHEKYLRTTVGKRLLKKINRLKEKQFRLKTTKTKRNIQKRESLEKIGKQPKAIKELSRREIRKIKKEQRLRSKTKRKLLINKGINMKGIDMFFNLPIIEVLRKPTKLTNKINEFIKKSPTKTTKITPKDTEIKTGKGQIQLLKTIQKTETKVKKEIKIIKQQEQKFKTLQKQELIYETKVKSLQKTTPRNILIPKLKFKIKIIQKQQQKIKNKTKQAIRSIIKSASRSKSATKSKVKSIIKSAVKSISKVKSIVKSAVKSRVKSRVKSKVKSVVKSKLKLKQITKFKPKTKPKPPIKLDDKKRKKEALEYLKTGKLKRKFIYLPDVAAILEGRKLKGKLKKRYLNPNMVFTGLERRGII